ncbi:Oxygen-independent coproporphyrinogen III oxidase [Candidatus Zixiibacteriota bacterium]|nr:Oxygen-independent coproporphyrinogen III oxidase [candidate division Zixibacteria bacterium]
MSLGLYIHFPFCTNFCSYCDFYKEIHSVELEKLYYRALEIELALAIPTIDPEDRELASLYIGGGTPSLTDLNILERFVASIKKHFILSKDLEFSFEINPESIDAEKLQFLKALGVNRPIFGMQSFNFRQLKLLNRKHKLEDSFRAVYLARALSFDNFGIDMIFGLPKQTARTLGDDLNQIIELMPPHISYYQLTVEKGTPLENKIESGKLKLPDSDLCAGMYRAINEELNKHKYFRYEISSFAQPGYECRHNLRYWDGGDFLGLGPSAHSFIGEHRFANSPDLNFYLKQLSGNKRPLILDTDSREARISEAIMLGLRTAHGIERRQFLHRFGISVEEAIDRASYEALVKGGMIAPNDEHIKLTESGFPLADEIIRRLVK